MKRLLPFPLALLTMLSITALTAVAQTPSLVLDGSDPSYQGEGEQDDAPVPRVARISFLQGDVSFLRAGVKEWSDAAENLPLLAGDQIYVGDGGRAEIQFERGNYVRLSEKTALTITELSPTAALLEVTEGIAFVRLERFGSAWERFEVDTPNSALLLKQDGLYRINVRGDKDSEVIIRHGSAEVSSAEGNFTVREGQRLIVDTTPNGRLEIAADLSTDDWDKWSFDRDRDTDYTVSSAAPSYVGTYETTYDSFYGVSELGSYGYWSNFSNYGYCWFPRVATGWAPYRYGQWVWIPRIGWTWLANERWGWAPYHYGRWVNINGVWAWAPGFHTNYYHYGRSYYQWRPALVGFFNYSSPRGNYVGWYPLSVGERWRNPLHVNNDHGHLQYPTARDSWHRPADNGRPRIGNGATVIPINEFGGNRRTNRTFETPGSDAMNWAHSRGRAGLPDLGGAENASTGVLRHGEQAAAHRPVTPPADVISRPVVTRTRQSDIPAGTAIVPRERRVIGTPSWRKYGDSSNDGVGNGSQRPRIGGGTSDATENRRHKPDDVSAGGAGNANNDAENWKRRTRLNPVEQPAGDRSATDKAERKLERKRAEENQNSNGAQPNNSGESTERMRPREERRRNEQPQENNSYRERQAQPVEPQRSREEHRQEKQERRAERAQQQQSAPSNSGGGRGRRP